MRLAGNDDLLAAAELVRRFELGAIDAYVSLIEQKLHAGTADALELRGDEMIEALAGGFRWNGDGAGHVSARLSHSRAFAQAGWIDPLIQGSP